MPEDILYPIKARDEATPVFSQFLATLAGVDKATEKLTKQLDELKQKNQVLTAALFELEKEQRVYSATLESAAKGSQAWSEAQAKALVLNERIATTEKELGKNKEQLSQAQKKLTEAAQASGGAFQNLGTLIKNFAEAPLQTAHQGINALLASLGPTAVGIGAVATGVALAGAALAKMGIEASETAEHLKNMAIQTGLTTQELQALTHIAKEAGLEGINFARSIGMLNKQLASDEAGTFVKVLNSMRYAAGETAADLNTGIIPLLDDFRAHILAIADPNERARLSNLAFQRGLRDLIPIIEDETKSLSESIEMQKRAGTTWSDETERNLLKLHDGINELGRIWEGLKVTVGGAIGSMMGNIYEYVDGVTNAQLSTRQLYEMWAKQTPKGGMPTFEQFPPFYVPEQDPMKKTAEALARAKAIASGKKEDLDLVVKIGETQERFDQAVAQANVKRAEALAQELAFLKQTLAANEELRKQAEELPKKYEQVYERLKDIQEATAKINEDIERKGHAALVPAGREIEAGLRRNEKIAKDIIKDAQEAEEKRRKAGLEAWEYWEKGEEKRAEYYDNLLDSWREGAGRVFDAIVSRGKGAFQSLADWIEGIFLSRLRIMFENFFANLFSRLPILGGGEAGGRGGSAGQMAGQFAQGGFGGFFSNLLGGGGQKGWTSAGTYGMRGPASQMQAELGGKPGFMQSAGGQALLAGAAIGGSMLWSDASKRGSALEGFAGGGLTGASIGFSLGGPVGAAIGAGIGAVAGFFTGLFGGAAKRRAEEAARRAGIQAQGLFAAPETIARAGAFGMAGEADVETDLLGRVRAIRPVQNTIIIKAWDARDLQENADEIVRLINHATLRGGSQLADNIGYAAE